MTMHPTPSSLDRLRLDEIDWSRCSGRDLHRLAEGAAQAEMRRKLVGPEGLTVLIEFNALAVSNRNSLVRPSLASSLGVKPFRPAERPVSTLHRDVNQERTKRLALPSSVP